MVKLRPRRHPAKGGRAGKSLHLSRKSENLRLKYYKLRQPGVQEEKYLDDNIVDYCSVLQSFIFLFFTLDFHAAIFVSPFMSMAEAVVSAQANFRPLAVNI